MSITNRIEKVRAKKRIPKSEFGELVGMSRDSVYNISDAVIKVSTLVKIAEVLETPLEYFLGNLLENSDKPIVQESEIPYKKSKAKVVLELNPDDILTIDLKNRKLEIIKK